MKKLYFLLSVAVIPLLVVLFFAYNPEKYSFFPKCPFHFLTGFDCPGCGSQRAVHALLHGNLSMAMDYNFLLATSIPFLFVHASYKARNYYTGKKGRWIVVDHPLTPKIIFTLVVAFWILRNIPYAPFNYLAA